MNPKYPHATPKQSIAFPEAALIRKGTAKQIGQNGKETVGKDLNDKFRIQFYPGVDPAIIETFKKAYGETPKRIKAFIPFPHVSEAFSSFNEAHNAGRMVAQADDAHYLVKRNPLNGQYEVRNGQPYTPFQPGEKIVYTNAHNKQIELPIKPTNRLRLVIPEVVMSGRLVTFTFKSTSIYDRFNLEQQLGAIQALANTLNRGNAAGIPFWLYRAEREITWNKADGSASRLKKWLVHLEPDAEWVKSAFERMSKFALTGSTAASLPESIEEPLEVDDDFGEEEEDEEEALFGEEPVILAGKASDVPPPPATPPARTPARQATSRPQASSLPTSLPAAKNGNGNGKTQAHADPNAPLAVYNRIGKMLWQSKWPDASAAITKNVNPASLAKEDLKKALELVQKRYNGITDLKKLAEHLKKVWPDSDIAADLAHTMLASTENGKVDHLILIQAVDQAEGKQYESPDTHAQAIVGHYLRLHPEPLQPA